MSLTNLRRRLPPTEVLHWSHLPQRTIWDIYTIVLQTAPNINFLFILPPHASSGTPVLYQNWTVSDKAKWHHKHTSNASHIL